MDSSAVMGHDALQQPSWPQAQRRASHRQHDGSQADKVKDHRRCQGRGLPHGPHLVMLFLSAPSWLSTGWALLKSLADFSEGLSFTSSFFQLQRLSSERTQVRHRLCDAEQSSVIPAVRRPEQSDTISSFILDTALRQNISSKRHSSSGRANGTTGLPRRMGCAGQRQLLQSRSSDVLESPETRHQCQVEFVRRPFRRGRHRLATGRPPSPKRLLSVKGLESTTPLRPQQELEELRLKKENSRKQQTWNQSPKGMTKHRQSQKSRKTKRLKSENTKSKSLGSNPKAARELARAQLQKGYYRPGRYKSTPQVGSLLHGTRHRLPTVRSPGCPDSKAIRASANCALRREPRSLRETLTSRRRHPLVKQASEPRTASEPRAISDCRTAVSMTLSIPKIANIQSLCPDDTPRCQSTSQRVQCWPSGPVCPSLSSRGRLVSFRAQHRRAQPTPPWGWEYTSSWPRTSRVDEPTTLGTHCALDSPTQDNPVQALRRPRSPQTRSPYEQSSEHVDRKSM